MSVVAKTTIFRYDNVGMNLGVLDYDEATHEEDLDGSDVLTVKTRTAISKRERLVWKDNGGYWHEHIVDTTTREHSRGAAMTTAKCSNSINELYGRLARNVRIDDGTMFGEKKDTVKKLMAFLLYGTRWTLGTCDDFGVVKLEVWHKSVRECIADICTETGGELVTSVQVGQEGVTKRIVGIVKQRGSTARMRQFRYGANVSNVKREVGQDTVYTAIVAYGAKVAAATLNAKLAALQRQYDESEDSDERAEIQKDITKTRDDIRKLNEDDYAERITVRVRSTRKNASDIKRIYGVPNIYGDIEDSWMTYTDAQCPSASILKAKAERILRANDRPVVYYEFDVAQVGDDLWRDVRLGNRVLCLDTGFNPSLELDERVSYISRSLSGRMRCIIAIGERTNPLVEQYQANQNLHRATTGNKAKQNASTPPSSGGNYTGADWPADEGWDEEGYDPDYTEGGEGLPQPAGISITTPPTRLDYVEGEEIDFTGMVVVLIDGNGDLFTDDAHPDGVVPDNEQTRPVTTCPYGESTYYQSDLEISGWTQPIPTFGKLTAKSHNQWYETITYEDKLEPINGAKMAIINSTASSSFSLLFACDQQITHACKRTHDTKENGEITGHSVEEITTPSLTYTYNGKTVYYVVSNYSNSSGYDSLEPAIYGGPKTDDIARKVAWTIVYGEPAGGNTDIPVYYGEFVDYFRINITAFDDMSWGTDGGASSSGGGKWDAEGEPFWPWGNPNDDIPEQYA